MAPFSLPKAVAIYWFRARSSCPVLPVLPCQCAWSVSGLPVERSAFNSAGAKHTRPSGAIVPADPAI